MKPSDYIRKGWCQGHNLEIRDGVQHCCIYGAIELAYPGKELGKIEYRASIARKVLDKTGLLVSEFNDTPGRTQQEVIDLLESIGE